jgi:hypothetical protein
MSGNESVGDGRPMTEEDEGCRKRRERPEVFLSRLPVVWVHADLLPARFVRGLHTRRDNFLLAKRGALLGTSYFVPGT